MGKRKNWSPVPGQKKPHTSKKILPRGESLPPNSTPKPVLAEFAKGGNIPLGLLTPSTKHDAPNLPGYRCSAAWAVSHTREQAQRFRAVVGALRNERVLYHGTKTDNILSIVAEGLRTGNRYCMFGPGIYLGGPEKAINYTGMSSRACYLLQVRVALGKIKECPTAIHFTLCTLQAEGYNSVAGVAGRTQGAYGPLNHTEYVVYSPDQVFVTKVFELQRLNPYQALGSSDGCCIAKKSNAPAGPGNQAFADILNTRQCGTSATVQVYTTNGTFMICNNCIRELRLRIGSRITVYVSTYKGSIKKEVRVLTGG